MRGLAGGGHVPTALGGLASALHLDDNAVHAVAAAIAAGSKRGAAAAALDGQHSVHQRLRRQAVALGGGAGSGLALGRVRLLQGAIQGERRAQSSAMPARIPHGAVASAQAARLAGCKGVEILGLGTKVPRGCQPPGSHLAGSSTRVAQAARQRAALACSSFTLPSMVREMTSRGRMVKGSSMLTPISSMPAGARQREEGRD